MSSGKIYESIGSIKGKGFEEFDQHLVALRAQLGDEKFKCACEEGETMLLEQAIARDRGIQCRRVEFDAADAGSESLADVDKLVLSKRTVHAHLRSIYSKLDVTTRSAATRFAIEHKIV